MPNEYLRIQTLSNHSSIASIRNPCEGFRLHTQESDEDLIQVIHRKTLLYRIEQSSVRNSVSYEYSKAPVRIAQFDHDKSSDNRPDTPLAVVFLLIRRPNRSRCGRDILIQREDIRNRSNRSNTLRNINIIH